MEVCRSLLCCVARSKLLNSQDLSFPLCKMGIGFNSVSQNCCVNEKKMGKTSNIAIVTKMGALGVLVSLFFFWNPKVFGQISLEGRQIPILPLSGLGKSTTVNSFVLEPRALTPSPSLVIPRDLGSGL